MVHLLNRPRRQDLPVITATRSRRTVCVSPSVHLSRRLRPIACPPGRLRRTWPSPTRTGNPCSWLPLSITDWDGAVIFPRGKLNAQSCSGGGIISKSRQICGRLNRGGRSSIVSTEEQRALGEGRSITVARLSPERDASGCKLGRCGSLFDLNAVTSSRSPVSHSWRVRVWRAPASFPHEVSSPRLLNLARPFTARVLLHRRQSPGRRAKLHRSVASRVETLSIYGHLRDYSETRTQL